MKDIYFEILDFEGKIPDNYCYTDLGYTDNLLETTRELYKKQGLPNDNEYLKKAGAPLTNNPGGRHVVFFYENGISTFVYYTHFSNFPLEIFNRAHEESHAVITLGLKEELKKKMNLSFLANLSKENFCDKAGLSAIKNKGLKLPPGLIRLWPGERVYFQW